MNIDPISKNMMTDLSDKLLSEIYYHELIEGVVCRAMAMGKIRGWEFPGKNSRVFKVGTKCSKPVWLWCTLVL